MRILTLQFVKDRGACLEACLAFEKRWGQQVEVTEEMADEAAIEVPELDFEWAGDVLLTELNPFRPELRTLREVKHSKINAARSRRDLSSQSNWQKADETFLDEKTIATREFRRGIAKLFARCWIAEAPTPEAPVDPSPQTPAEAATLAAASNPEVDLSGSSEIETTPTEDEERPTEAA